MPKAKTTSTADAAATPKRGPGRPRKNPLPQVTVNATDAAEDFEELNSLFSEPIKVVPLEEQSYETLFDKAKNIYRLPVTSDFTKNDLIAAITRKQTGRQVDVALSAADVQGDAIPPGWAKIELFKDTSPKATNRPHYCAVNGYRCMVPFGVPVLVPLKILEVIKNAKEIRRMENPNKGNRDADASTYRIVEVQRLPYTVHGQTPGPDPRPKYETMKAINLRPREAYVRHFGRWPTNAELRVAVSDGIIKLGRQGA